MFRVFLRLGVTSFGGPIAHLGYFRDELVVRRHWVDDATYADLVALCQFLPGPTSSQVGFSLGFLRGGFLGAFAAWCAFTLPSAALMALFAMGFAAFGGEIATGLFHGLKLVSVAIVAQAVWGMTRSLASEIETAALALVSFVIVIVLAGPGGQIAAILAGCCAGLVACRRVTTPLPPRSTVSVSRRVGIACLVLFAALLAGLPILSVATASHGVAIFDAFYRSGALVFGGGHVVLPLLETAVVQPGWVAPDVFLAGYGAAQAMPGPLFTFAAFLGASMTPRLNGLLGATSCLIAIFLPGLLLITGALPFWNEFRSRPLARAAMRGTNAAVVGILAAALYNPVWTSAVLDVGDVIIAITAFALLTVLAAPSWAVVVLTAASGVVWTLVH